MSKTTSDNGIKQIKAREGEVLHGYLDSVKKLTTGVEQGRGKVAKGLVTRRNAERLQFMTPDK